MGFLDKLFRRPPSPERFGALVLRHVTELGITEPVHFDAPRFRILVGDEGQRIINLENFYDAYCRAAHAQRPALIRKWMQLFTPSDLPADFADARAHLMPILRSRALLEYMRLGSNGAGKQPQLALPFSRDAKLMLAYDGQDSLQTLSHEELARWGVDPGAALAVAMDQLRDATPDQVEEIAPGVFHGTWNDAFDSSRLLLPDLAHRVAGARPAAMVPTRGHLLLAPSGNVRALRTMIELAHQCADQEARYVSALLYRYEDGRALAWTPEDEAARLRLAQLERRFLYADYDMQKQMLDELHARTGVDLFVAKYKVVRADADGEEFSMAVWSKDVETLLPQAERVSLVLMDEQGQLARHEVLAWDDLLALAGPLLAPVPDAYPPLFRTTGFPALPPA